LTALSTNDPFLADYIDDLRAAVECLKRLRSGGDVRQAEEAARDACEAARDIFLRIWPPSSDDRPTVKLVVQLMGRAIALIDDQSDGRFAKACIDNITARRAYLVKSLRRTKSRRRKQAAR
jgi:hypothetical protein